jgi:purine catabolism regulator
VLTLREVLDLPVLARGRPELLHGHEQLARQVRWVHTSEIAGIGPLLKGGEVLLTTGLGLAGADGDAQRRYVSELAERGITALFLEIGRTFASVPEPLRDEALARGLPLVTLHGVVPFVEVTEAVHALLISRRLEDLSRADAISEALNDVLLSGGGLGAVLARVAGLAGAAARVTGPGGRVMATSDTDVFGDAVPLRPRPRATVTVFGRAWGHLELDLAPGTSTGLLLERAAVAVGIELVRTGETANPQRLARHAFLSDLAQGRLTGAAEVRTRAEVVGVRLIPGTRVHGLAVCLDRTASTRAAHTAAESVARSTLASADLAISDDECLGVVRVSDEAELRTALDRFVAAFDAELKVGGTRVRAAAAGPSARSFEGLARSLAAARESCTLSQELAMGPRPLLATDVAVHRLLRGVDDMDLERLIDEQLGPLLEHDGRHRGQLLRTLEVFVQCGANKTTAANRLGIRRQSLYARLQRIERIAGAPLDSHDRLLALELALLAWRLRSAGSRQSHAVPDRSP